MDFGGPKSVGEIDVFTLQDNSASPVEPTSALTFTQSGLTAFQAQYWTGSAWADVPGGNVTGNSYVWRRFGFAPVVTERIRVLANAGAGGSSRIVELEAWSVPHYEISGTVSTNGAPAAGVALAADNGARCGSSNASGQYVCTVLPGWSGTVTPSSPSYNFTPASRSYASVAADQAGQDYAGAQYVSISGTITSNGAPLAGAPVAASGASCTSSDASGHYSCTVPKSWSGSVAPLGGYSYTPMSRSYASVTADQGAQDYAGAASTVAISYVQVDHLNTPRAVSNASGALLWRWDQTEPFGDSVPNDNPSGVGSFEFQLAFEGQYRDKEIGVSQNRFRDYDSRLGRYIESDPLGLRGGINTYAYVGGNPLKNVDPLGLLVWKCKYHSRTLIEILGAGVTTYTCTSPCMNGMRATIDVVFAGPGLGAGIPNVPVGESYGDISFDDHLDYISPSSFSGVGMNAGAGVEIGGFGVGANRTRLGRAYSTGTGGHQSGGMNVGIELVAGSSTVTDVRLETCDECRK